MAKENSLSGNIQRLSRREALYLIGGGVLGLAGLRIFSNDLLDHYRESEAQIARYLKEAWSQGITQLDWGLYPDWHGDHLHYLYQINEYVDRLNLSTVGYFTTFEELQNPYRVEEMRVAFLNLHQRGLTPQLSIGNGSNSLEHGHMFHPANRAVIAAQAQELAAFLAQFDFPVQVRPWFEMNIAAPYGYKWFGKGYFEMSDEEHVIGYQACWQILHDTLQAQCPLVELVFSPSGIAAYPFEAYVPRNQVTGQLLCQRAGFDIYDMNAWPMEIFNPYYLPGFVSPDTLVYEPLKKLKVLTGNQVPVGLCEFNSYTHKPQAEMVVAAAVAAAGGTFLNHFDVPKRSHDPQNYLRVVETNWTATPEQLQAMERIANRLAEGKTDTDDMVMNFLLGLERTLQQKYL